MGIYKLKKHTIKLVFWTFGFLFELKSLLEYIVNVIETFTT